MTELAFSEKYSTDHAEAYYLKHRTGFRRRLSNLLEQAMVSRSLSRLDVTGSVLDLPCGAGRFWDLLEKHGCASLLGADYSQAMLDVAGRHRPHKVNLLQTSAFDTCLADSSVDTVVCLRFLHHVGNADDRLKLLRELRRISARHLIISLWVDGNYQAWRRRRLEIDRVRRERRRYRNRFVIDRDVIEQEFLDAGLDIIGYSDLLPGISAWRCYVLGKA